MGSNTGGTNGWFPTVTSIYDLADRRLERLRHRDVPERERRRCAPTTSPSSTAPAGSRSDPTAPATARGPAPGSALALVDRQLYAAGNFTSAGGDTQAQSVASFSLTQIIAYPTPTVTPGPSAQPTPTVTPSPTPPLTSRRPPRRFARAQISQAMRKATFRFNSGEPGSTFSCQLDKLKVRRCTSPKTYKKLAPGKHVFRVKARDRAGNLDKTPAVTRFRIKKR